MLDDVPAFNSRRLAVSGVDVDSHVEPTTGCYTIPEIIPASAPSENAKLFDGIEDSLCAGIGAGHYLVEDRQGFLKKNFRLLGDTLTRIDVPGERNGSLLHHSDESWVNS